MGNIISFQILKDINWEISLFGIKKSKKIRIYNSSRNPQFPPFISNSVSASLDRVSNIL